MDREALRLVTWGLPFVALGVVIACGASGDDEASNDAITAGQTVDVQILAINDFHGNLEPPTGNNGLVTVPADDPLARDPTLKRNDAGAALLPVGGAAFLAAHVKRLRATNPNTLVVSAGDLTGASPFLSNLFKDEPAVLAMNAIGLDFEAVGNHDFDRGLPELLRLQKGGCSLNDCAANGSFVGAKYQYLAANVERQDTQQTVFPPFVVKSFGDAKVAVIGMTLEDTPSVTNASAIAGLAFANEAKTVNALVPQLKADGVSAIIVLLHQGGFQAPEGTYDSCAQLAGDLLPVLKGNPAKGTPALDPAVDVVASAHTHQAYDCVIDDRIVTSAASFGRVVTKIDLSIDPTAKRVVTKKAHNVPVTRDIEPDPEVAGIVATYQSKSAPLANRVVGWIASDITRTPSSHSCETPMGSLLADAQLAGTQSAGAVVAFVNAGGQRADLSARATGKADNSVTFAEAFAVQPFANNLITMTLTGAQIQTILGKQFGGVSPLMLGVSQSLTYAYVYDAASHRATIDPASIKINGAVVDPAGTYRASMGSFLAGGGDGFTTFAEGTDRASGMVDLEALTSYLGQKSSQAAPLAPPAPGRVQGNACP